MSACRTSIGVILFAVLALGPALVRAEELVVTPEETDELLANPGVGWETFGTPANRDRSLPKWIPSTVHYTRWGWAEVEPQAGKIDTGFIDKQLKESHDAGQKLAFRVMCCSTSAGRPYHPAWLTVAGGKEITAVYGMKSFPIPDFDDSATLQLHLDLIQRLGRRYDGHADLAHVDLGSVGWWGEWHMSGAKGNKMPALENRLKIVDAYFAAFKKTPLLMLIGDTEILKYACAHGAGWRADCLGDMGGFSKKWYHMRDAYPVEIKQAEIQDVWKTAPVAWETCWDMRKWVSEGWSLRYIFNYALACHASVLNNKSAPLPDGNDVRPELERFLRRLGYRIVLKELRHPAQAQAGGKLSLAMKWQNTGSAPCYKAYRVAFRLSQEGGVSKVIVGEATVNRWLPGTLDVLTPDFLKSPGDLPPGEVMSVTENLSLADVPAGKYTLALGIVDDASVPVVRLGIKGRGDDGWYPVSRVEVLK